MEVLQRKDLSSIRVPMGGDKVYKDECVYSFDTPVSDSCVAPAVSFKFHSFTHNLQPTAPVHVATSVLF